MTAAPWDAFARLTRFGAMTLAIDLEHPQAVPLLARIANADAQARVRMARAMSLRFVVLAGQLHRRSGGCHAALVRSADAVPVAVVGAHHRLTALGERVSALIVLADPAVSGAVEAAVAIAAATEGSA